MASACKFVDRKKITQSAHRLELIDLQAALQGRSHLWLFSLLVIDSAILSLVLYNLLKFGFPSLSMQKLVFVCSSLLAVGIVVLIVIWVVRYNVNKSGEGLIVTLWTGADDDIKMTGSGSFLSDRYSWNVHGMTEARSNQFGFVWHPRDNPHVLQCAYARDGNTQKRQGDLCGDSAEPGDPERITCDNLSCLRKLSQDMKSAGCPRCQQANEVVFRKSYNAAKLPTEAFWDILAELQYPPAALVIFNPDKRQASEIFNNLHCQFSVDQAVVFMTVDIGGKGAPRVLGTSKVGRLIDDLIKL